MRFKNILKKKSKKPKKISATAPPPSVEVNSDQIESDLEKLMQFEQRILSRKPELEERNEKESQEALALKLKNPFRGM